MNKKSEATKKFLKESFESHGESLPWRFDRNPEQQAAAAALVVSTLVSLRLAVEYGGALTHGQIQTAIDAFIKGGNVVEIPTPMGGYKYQIAEEAP